MNKLAFASVVCVSFAFGAAAQGIVTTTGYTGVPNKALEVMARKAGGMIVAPNSQKGEVVYVNCQKRAPEAWIKEAVKSFADLTRFKVTYKEGTFDLAAPKIEGNVTLFIVDDEKLPPILFAPESRWAFVNIAPIAKETRPAFFEARTRKELVRGVSFLCGATNSQYPRSLTRGIVDQSDLDKNPDLQLPFDVIQRFPTYMEPLGVTPARVVMYRQACQEGWAPKPTNDVQKAVWDKVHALPSKPIKIEYDEKRDAGK